MHAVDVLRYGHLTVMRAIENLPDDDWLTPNVCGVWSVKEIIAHLASFERVLVEALRAARGEPLGRYLTDLTRDGQLFNETQVAMRIGYSVAETLAEYEETHAETMALAATLPPSLYFNTGFMPAYGMEYDLEEFIVYTFYGHKREHSAQIAVFRDLIQR